MNSSLRGREVLEPNRRVESGAFAPVVRRVGITCLVNEPSAIRRASKAVPAGIYVEGDPAVRSGRNTAIADVHSSGGSPADPISLRVPEWTVLLLLRIIRVDVDHAQPR